MREGSCQVNLHLTRPRFHTSFPCFKGRTRAKTVSKPLIAEDVVMYQSYLTYGDKNRLRVSENYG